MIQLRETIFYHLQYGGYQSVIGDIRQLSSEIENQRARSMSPLRDLPFQRNLSNSAVAYNTYHGKGKGPIVYLWAVH